MQEINVTVGYQLLDDCLFALNDIPNRKVRNGLNSYDLARDLGRALQRRSAVCISWNIADVLRYRGDLDDDEAKEVLLLAKQQFDADAGRILTSVANSLYPLPK